MLTKKRSLSQSRDDLRRRIVAVLSLTLLAIAMGLRVSAHPLDSVMVFASGMLVGLVVVLWLAIGIAVVRQRLQR